VADCCNLVMHFGLGANKSEYVKDPDYSYGEHHF